MKYYINTEHFNLLKSTMDLSGDSLFKEITQNEYDLLLLKVQEGYALSIVDDEITYSKPLVTTKAEKTTELLAFLDTVVQTSVTHSGLEFAPNTTNVVYLLLTAKQSGSDFTVIDDTNTLHENVSQATVSNICTMLLDMIHSIRVYRANKLQEIANAETNEQVEAIVIGDDF